MENEKLRSGRSASLALGRSVENLADELVSRWAPLFAHEDWPGRLKLLQEIHEQLQEDLGDLDTYSAVSPVFIRKLIENLSGGPVACAAQAQIYANSDDDAHRRAAHEWLSQNPSVQS
jgi:hypothetical protein